MKFAVLALIGTTAAVRTEYAGADTHKAYEQVQKIMATAQEAERNFPEHQAEIQARAEKLVGVAMQDMMEKMPKYLPELEAW